jgi:nickel-dependent lactate racemase
VSDLERCHHAGWRGVGGWHYLLEVIAWKTISQQMTSINIYGRFYLLSTLKEHHARQFYDKWTTYVTNSDNIIAAWCKRRRKRKDKIREEEEGTRVERGMG